MALAVFPAFSDSFSPAEFDMALEPVFYLETEYSPGKYIQVASIPEGAVAYSGGDLSLNNQLKRRMYTFFCSFNLDENLKGQDLAIYTSPANYSERFYLNGLEFQKFGMEKEEYNASSSDSLALYLPKRMLNYGKQENLLIIECYPITGEKGVFHDMRISTYEHAFNYVFIRNLISFHLIQAASIVSLFVFIYFLFLFFSRKSRDMRLFWFGLVCFCFSLAYSNLVLNSPVQDLLFVDKLSRIFFPWTVTFLSFFIFEFTGILNKSRVLKGIFVVASLVFNVWIILQPSSIKIQEVFNYIMYFFIAPQLVLSMILLIISLIRNKHRQSLYIFTGYLVILFSAGWDIYNSSLGFLPYTWLVPYGFFAILACIFFILALEQAKTYAESLSHLRNLDIKNASLKELMNDILTVSKQVFASNGQLETSIRNAGTASEKYRESNREVLEKIHTQFNFIESSIADISKRIEISKERIPEAITNQTSMVARVTETVSTINEQIASTLSFMEESNKVAQNLFKVASDSSRVIEDTRASIEKISEYSAFLRDVLNVLEDITEKTSLLSINASIEAARSGIYGKGFNVVAGEIKNLALISKDNLDHSLGQMKEMASLIQSTSQLSAEVSGSLFVIISESNNSANMVNKAMDLVKDQEKQSSEIYNSVNSLLKDARAIKAMTDAEKADNEKIMNVFKGMQESLGGITKLLSAQEQNQSLFTDSLAEIKAIMQENQTGMNVLIDHVEKLEV